MGSIWRLDSFDWRGFGKKLWECQGRIMAQSARLSFYLMFALFPFLLFLTALLGWLLETQEVLREFIERHLYAVAPESVTSLLKSVVQEISHGSSGGKLSFGLLFALWAASSGMRALIDALNNAYGIAEARVWWKQRGVAIGMTVGFLALSLLALALLLYGPKMLDALMQSVGFGSAARVLWEIGRWLVMGLFLLLAFNLLYVLGPNVKHREWHWLMPGTLLGVSLWIAVSFGFKLYLAHFNRYSTTYGSIGGVMILMLWLYLSGIAIILGAELNSALEQRDGKIKEKEKAKQD